MFFYSDTGPKSTFDARLMSRLDATECYMTHLNNYFYLKFMQTNGTFKEKSQATIELDICERKMKFWERNPEFDKSIADAEMKSLKRKWNMK